MYLNFEIFDEENNKDDDSSDEDETTDKSQKSITEVKDKHDEEKHTSQFSVGFARCGCACCR